MKWLADKWFSEQEDKVGYRKSVVPGTDEELMS